MAKILTSIRLDARLKAWAEKKAKRLNTTETWIIEKAMEQMAGDEIPRSFELGRPERRKNK